MKLPLFQKVIRSIISTVCIGLVIFPNSWGEEGRGSKILFKGEPSSTEVGAFSEGG